MSKSKKLPEKIARWLDPKLEPYRPAPPPPPEPPKPAPYTPKNLMDLLGVIRRTPRTVLTDRERGVIAAAMSFSERRVTDIMLPKDKITFVHDKDFLGPLMLDKLYRSGFSHFPVVDFNGRLVGLLHTKSLNNLEIRDTDRAEKYLDPTVYYLRNDYTLEQALAAFLRTNCYFFMVVDRMGAIVGLLTYKMLAVYLFGYEPKDDFDRDTNLAAVIRR